MTELEFNEKIAELPDGVADATHAMMNMCSIICEEELSIEDLMRGCSLAINSGHDMAQICLSMMSFAIRRVADESTAQIPNGSEAGV